MIPVNDELHAADWITITGRGRLALIETPCENPSLFKNQIVNIDGHLYRVRGVELTHPRKPSDPYGLLVRDD